MTKKKKIVKKIVKKKKVTKRTSFKGQGIFVRLKEDDTRFKMKKGDVLRVIRYAYDNEKYTVLERVSDGYDPECNVYFSQVERL